MEKVQAEKYSSCLESVEQIIEIVKHTRRVIDEGKIKQQKVLEKNGFHSKKESNN